MLAATRSLPPTCTSSSPARRAARSGPPPSALADDLDAGRGAVLFDDREGVSPGVKFKDAELIGVPTIVVVGRGIADDGTGTVEVKDRRTGERADVALDEAVAHLTALTPDLPDGPESTGGTLR